MQVISRRTLKLFWERHPHAEGPLRAWFTVVSNAKWTGPQSVKEHFGATVDFLADDRLVFDLSGNKYRLVVRVAYRFGRVLVKFVGTHAEYDRINAGMVSWRR
ncbi:MAG: type II toxin-antitoxin system HigB family toxin [Bauldia sp.]|nr:type II toxin-antitoxin system HigB family toxin [Bauldia sp.]